MRFQFEIWNSRTLTPPPTAVKHFSASKQQANEHSDRDTEAEVETALRVFPEVLSRRGGPDNVKAVSFIPLVARLALGFGLFEEKERGGLLLEDEKGDNILQLLVHQDVDDTYLNVKLESNDNNLSAPLPFGGTAPTPGMGGFGGGPSQTPGMGGFCGGGTTLTPTPGGFDDGGFGQQAPPQQQAQARGFGNTTFNAQAGGQFSLGTDGNTSNRENTPPTGRRRILKARRRPR
ncbi:hypothetical protein FRACYDRAFT_247291 [Fragilariopsis cylindrus CCMP1102]|uniref:Uncharacterized protein n=1 Tax=Fragilariopsis cylindrus CCMP1102 TaxID=635003 RepID=A0A1E7EWH8_9STRA|nr:hypothetical protein FRACYDRAFT_247291 [Fragilariopsis cylindrus CCMP1102]|eukprot:OEU10321.1 hypothetical protein FRACYDRAFT_247291 [Fragilariopsis cylindrus CCMP1102]